MRPTTDFDQAPFLVIWETTRACDLACVHCRAEARPGRDLRELSTVEAKRLIDDVRRFGPIVFVFSGGDCMKRPDLVELVAHAARAGLKVGATPAATPLCDRASIRALRDAGLARLAVSLDGSRPAIHDAFRCVPGSFDHGIRILEEARGEGLSTQVNTVIGPHDVDDLETIGELVDRLGVALWEVFCLVPVGRARIDRMVDADAMERVFHRLYDASRTLSCDLKVTAGPHYNRVVLERRRADRRTGRPDASAIAERVPGRASDGIGRARNVNDGDGFLFVAHTGEICPSGFLPVALGNVRAGDLVETYRRSPLLRRLRDRRGLQGKCGVCEYRDVCGGSRARAWAMTGDPFASDPLCAHVPKRWQAIA